MRKRALPATPPVPEPVPFEGWIVVRHDGQMDPRTLAPTLAAARLAEPSHDGDRVIRVTVLADENSFLRLIRR